MRKILSKGPDNSASSFQRVQLNCNGGCLYCFEINLTLTDSKSFEIKPRGFGVLGFWGFGLPFSAGGRILGWQFRAGVKMFGWRF